MIGFLLAPPDITIVIGAIVILGILWFIKLFFDEISTFVWFIRLAMTLIALYLLLHGIAWLLSRYMNT